MAPKRKADNKAKATTPSKRAKVQTPKAKAAAKKPEPKKKTPAPKVTSTKAKKVEPKKTPAKTPAKKTPAKALAPAKSTPAKGKTPAKAPAKSSLKTPAKTPAKDVKKPVKAKLLEKKPEPKKTEEKSKPTRATASITRAKLDKAKALKVSAAKAKLKTAKALPKAKPVQKKPVSQKKEEEKKEDKKPQKKTPEPKVTETKPVATNKKRKAEEPAGSPDVSGRKRRMITPNKKFADFEVDVPAKRMITPNKKYADYETETPSKSTGKVSELRAFIQDKKTVVKSETPKAEKGKGKATPTTSKVDKEEKEPSDDDSDEKIRIYKPSEMKPAEKLLKKLQKKLEKEAKGSPAPTPAENREKAKIKITKVVNYNKPLSSDDVQMKKLAKKIDAKAKTPAGKGKQTPKTPIIKTDVAKNDKPKATPKATSKVTKTTPKSTPEKVIKPKKIKEFKREERPIQAKYMFQKTIQLKDDNQKATKDESQKVQCWITGIGVFPSGEIIMVDMSNRKIKLFSKDFEYLSQIQLDTIPQDISVSPVNASCAYFTKPFSMEGIQKVVMADGKLSLKEYFVTNGTNRGITCTKAGILTSVQDGRYHDVDINHFKIYLLDYTGNVLQSVSTDLSGSRLFKLPLYFTVNSTGKQMIVADCIKLTSYIVSVDMSGKIKFKYEGTNGNGITPRGLTIDEEDNVYVTEWERNNIYILSPEGKRLQMLFSHQELQQECGASLSKPYQLCYYKTESERCLIVSQESCNTIKVFKILTKAEMDAERAAEAEKAKVDAEKKKEAENIKAGGDKPAAATAVTVPEVKKVTVNGDDPKVAKAETSPAVVSPQKPAVQAKVVTIITKKPSLEKVAVTQQSKPAVTKVELVSPSKQVIQKIEIPSPTRVAVPAAPTVITSSSSVPQATVVQVPDKVVQTVQVDKEQIPVATAAAPIIQTTEVETPVVESQQKQKNDIFADTANDFDDDDDEADEPGMNGELQNIVNAFPEEADVEATTTASVVAVTEPVSEEPPQIIQQEAEAPVPEVTTQPLDAVQQEGFVEQVIVQPPELSSESVQVAEVMPDNVMVVQDNIIDDNVQISETVVDPASQAAEVFTTYETVVYEDVPAVEGEIAMDTTQVVVTSQSLPEGTVTSETEGYQTVESEIPMELETITTEYCV